MYRKRQPLITIIIVLVLILAGLLAIATNLTRSPENPTLQTGGNTASTGADTQGTSGPEQQTQPSQEPTVLPTEPPVIKESTATIGATGDILMHGDVIESGKISESSYDFHDIFSFYSPYITQLDYAIANFEGTLCGSDNGYSYGGYPHFNSPDAILDALKSAGFDMLLTANNHSYDTRNTGFHRTQEAIASLGLDHTGTVSSVEDDNYIIQDINGIRIGMICYTYNTGVASDGSVSLNGIPLTQSNSHLINSFSYEDLRGFYSKLEGELEEMTLAGVEATVLFIHWGNEYQLKANSTQKTMAQALCDLGIDVIIGGHPHVIQPMELLTSTQDPNHSTVCLYSLGNALSNQRLGLISSCPTAHTEDGLLMSVTFAKYSDGTVIVESVDLLPTWINKITGSDLSYDIYPLDSSISDWKSAFGLTDSLLSQCEDSYHRTMAIVGDGLTQVQQWCARIQADLEASLGIQ